MKRFFYNLLFLLALAPSLAFAQQPQSDIVSQPSSNIIAQQNSSGTFKLADPLGVKNFCELVKALLNIVMAIGVPIAVLFLVWSGFKFIIARGSQEGLTIAKNNFYYVIIGIAIFLGAWTLASIISATIQTLDSSGTVQFCGR